MKLIFYMLKKFSAIFLGSMIFSILILSLTDLLLNIWGYVSKGVSSSVILQIMMLYIPKAAWYSVPIAILFATAYMLSDLYAKNELLAVFACGISLFRFTLPLMILSVFMSVGLFWFNDAVVVKSYEKKMSLQNKALEKEQQYDNSNVVVMSEGGKIIYKAEYFDSKFERLYSLYVLYRNNDRSFDGLVYAESAVWASDHWELSNSCFYKNDENEYRIYPVDYDHLFRLMEPPETFRRNSINVDEVTAAEAKQYILQLEKSGLPSNEAKAEYYKKYAFSFVVLVVVMLAIGLSGKTRKNVMIVSLALSITAVVLFYVMQMITMLMARFGTIPPVLGEWFPVIFFVGVSALLLKYART
ncbi:MAG: LptF/LptG family permease [Treponema sp.]|nr:LptF/LptG family permease [Treponema sp.]